MNKTEDYKSRKFVMCYLLMITATALLGFGRIDPAIWRDIVVMIFSAYVVGNVAQKFAPPQPQVG